MKKLLIAIVFLASFAMAQTAAPTQTDKPAEHSCCCKKDNAMKCDKDCCKNGTCKEGSCKDCCKSKNGKKGCKNC